MSESRATLSLVLLPGLDGTGELFAPFLEALPDEIATRVVTYPPDRVVSRAELLARIRSAAAETPDHVLVAESFSGTLAIEHAAARPPGLRGLVLVASFARNPLPCGIRWAAHCARSWMLPWPPPDFWVRRLLLGSGAPEARLMELRAALRSVERAVIADRIRQLARVNVINPLLRIAVPVLYLAGRRDRLVGPRGLQPIVRARPAVSIEVLDAPHLVLQTRPIEAVGAIQRFLEDLPKLYGSCTEPGSKRRRSVHLAHARRVRLDRGPESSSFRNRSPFRSTVSTAASRIPLESLLRARSWDVAMADAGWADAC